MRHGHPRHRIADLRPSFDRLRDAWQRQRPDARQRLDDLARLREAFRADSEGMVAAINADFGHRSVHESLVADAMTVVAEIDHLRGHLRRWMKPRRVGAGWRLWPARAQLRPEPLGVVGVMSPWNYPVNLALIPLATAIAAGNHVYLKPSEHTPHTSAWLRELLAKVFPADRVAVALGDGVLGAAFSALPFDHLVFTGSTAVGRKVMAAAAPNLTPLTLELGGKSPAIVDCGFPARNSPRRGCRPASGSTAARPASRPTTCWSTTPAATHWSPPCARRRRPVTATSRTPTTSPASSTKASTGACAAISTTRARAAWR